MNEMTPIIEAAIQGTAPGSRKRVEALKSVKWVLAADNGLYAGMIGLQCALVPAQHALIFDGRDSEQLKLSFYQTILKTPLTIELV